MSIPVAVFHAALPLLNSTLPRDRILNAGPPPNDSPQAVVRRTVHMKTRGPSVLGFNVADNFLQPADLGDESSDILWG